MAQIVIPSQELTEFDLPRVCVVTGATENVVFKDVKFQWYPRWVAALILINVLVMAVVAMALTKKVKGKLPFTEEAFATWRRGITVMTLSVIAAIVVFIASMVAFGNDVPVFGILGVLASIGGPIAVWVTMVRGKTVQCLKIADGFITLNVPSGQAALEIQRHLHAGTPAVAPAIAMPTA
ncbi:MAG: hypothetical protein JST54_11945 [Deltaproteobacteria bacterium]|nr:hypothetical protein [Deltaproteobacteria bacterium]